MTNDFDSRIRGLWQQPSGEPPRFTPEELRRRVASFERVVRHRNLREYLAAAAVIGVFAYYAWLFPTLLLRAGCGLIIVGTVYVIIQLRRRASSTPAPAEMGLRSCIDFQASELARQRDALNAVWSWYLLPFLPGMAVFLIGLFQFTKSVTGAAGRPFHTAAALAGFSIVAGCVAVVFISIGMLNHRAANRLQMQIDDLGRLTRDPA
ncbi:hypothetical protein [Occallatibacter savannae]|uniref:hypothetical protein n=1 Tax=Occallatibacter savannae TaxID=1002691 RepID=UPI000D68B43D|nr:hypothetical protein [Occallatibacter savannae]